MTDIVGREAELASIGAFLDGIRKRPGALLLEGQAGIGKTALWEEGLRQAEALPCRVLTCRPLQSEVRLPYVGLQDILGTVLDEGIDHLPRLQRHALDVALLRAEPSDPRLDPRAVSVGALEVLRQAASSAPVLLAVDDLQWLDPASARVVKFVLHRLEAEPIGLLGTALEGSGVVGSLQRALPEDRASRLAVGPLSRAALDQALRARLGESLSRDTLRKVHRWSGGNCLLALEMARAILAAGLPSWPDEPLPVPDRLRRVVRERLRRLSGATRKGLLVAASLGHPTTNLLDRALGEEAEEILREAMDNEVLSVVGGRIRFNHPIMASVVYSEASPLRRHETHRRLAEVVDDPEERALHLALAAEAPDAAIAQALDDAARSARARGAPEAAAELLDHAIRLTPADETEESHRRVLEAARCHFVAGAPERASGLLQVLVETLPAGAERSEAFRLLARIGHHHESWNTARSWLEAALREATDPVVRATIEIEFATALDVEPATAHDTVRKTLRVAQEAGDRPLQSQALAAEAFLRWLHAGERSPELWDRALALEVWRDDLPFWQPSFARAVFLLWSDDLDAARERFEVVSAHLADVGDEGDLSLVLGYRTDLECWAGNLEAAADLALQALQLAELARMEPMRAMALGGLAQVDAHRGLAEEARKRAQEAFSIGMALGVFPAIALGALTLGFLELSLGDPAGALKWLEPLVDPIGLTRAAEERRVRGFSELVDALIGVGRLDEADAALSPFEARAERDGFPGPLVASGRCRSLLQAATGDVTGAVQRLERVVSELDRLPMPIEHGRTHLALGQVLRRAKQKRAAREALERAVAIFERLPSPLWAERARAELSRIGGRSPTRWDLTPTEKRVAELVAEGLTNRETAEELFVTVNTVEGHLRSVYRKLGVRSRTELAAKLGART